MIQDNLPGLWSLTLITPAECLLPCNVMYFHSLESSAQSSVGTALLTTVVVGGEGKAGRVKKYSVCLTMRGAVCQGKMGAQSYKGKELSSANTLGEPRNGAFR